MKLAVALMLSLGVALLAQRPTVENAKLETRTVSGTLAAELSRIGAGPVWVAWAEPIIAGQHGDMCAWNRNGDYGREPGAPVRLEGETALVVLVRLENSKPGELRMTSPDCRLDAGGMPFYWFNAVSAAESISWLKAQANGVHGDTAIMAISLHRDAGVEAALEDLAAMSQPVETRKRAAFWLGNSRGARGVAVLKRMLENDPNADVRDKVVLALSQSKDPGGLPAVVDAARNDKDAHIRGQALFWLAQRAAANVSKDVIQNALANDPESAVRERAVFALSQMKDGEGVPILIELAKTHRDPAVRKKAMLWLGQSKDSRALEFFAQALK